MSSLIPTYSADQIITGLTEYLTTSFSLADHATSEALEDFLRSEEHGIFRGPYIRCRLPYAPASDWKGVLEWLPEHFVPYQHQAQAFRRLRSHVGGVDKRPDPTLVVTGTGSGKTEAFLYPILDHARRERQQGRGGMKALLLYPMNALANDQASRLAKLIASDSRLAGITAGIYTGESGDNAARRMSEESLISDRQTIRETPPDILLTNYKMLDQLLLRPEDRQIWQKSATSLQYIVLDEFHTYDGAQGTDVALLLRRLGLMLKRFQPEGFLNASDQQRVLGKITPVATSATLGADGDFSLMTEFAHTIFGEQMSADAVVTESLLDYPKWRAEIESRFHTKARKDHSAFSTNRVRSLANHILLFNAEVANGDGSYPERVHAAVSQHFFEDETGAQPLSIETAVYNLSRHPFIEKVLLEAADAVPLLPRTDDATKSLLDEVFEPKLIRTISEPVAAEFLTHVLTEIAYLRAELGRLYGWGGKIFPGVEAHLWIREVSRVERITSPTVEGDVFRWSDDGPQEVADASATWLPACYCRNCGRSGWMTVLEPGTSTPQLDNAQIRKRSVTDKSLQRPLIDATSELRAAESEGRKVGGYRDSGSDSAVLWLNTTAGTLNTTEPSAQERGDGSAIPVLTYAGKDADTYAREERCPSCGEVHVIRYLGSSIATLLSVALSNLFGMPELDQKEKKTLIFTDSVQDAAHRAGFVQSRARAFALRTLTRRAVGDQPVLLSQLPDLLVDQAADARSRFELLPPDLAHASGFSDFWSPAASKGKKAAATSRAKKRLALDLALEFGQRADLARSLTLTRAVSVAVSATDSELFDAAERALATVGAQQHTDAEISLVWARGVVEAIRAKGGIDHPWFKEYLKHDGNAYLLNRREARAKGVPSFPKGGAPKFPRIGPSSTKDESVLNVGATRGFFAQWTAKVLGVSTHEAAKAMVQLIKELATIGVLRTEQSVSGATMYALPPERIQVDPETKLDILECDVCHARLGVSEHVRDQLDLAPCQTQGCRGRYQIETVAGNYYRMLYQAQQPRTVVAAEHTSLLEKDERQQLEAAFRSDNLEAPDSPNALVATPTLEMGIDIGDLSTVMLSSLPNSVASYVQRVGRAGRLTGNSLVIALVRGRGVTLPKLNQPLSVIGGSVMPPVAFLSAVEILQRQFTAYLIDCLDLAANGIHFRWARDVFNDRSERKTLIDLLVETVASGVHAELDAFISTVTNHVDPRVINDLRGWVHSDSDESLRGLLLHARKAWNDENQQYLERRAILEKLILRLQKDVDSGLSDDEVTADLRSAQASSIHLRRQLSNHQNEHWVSALERQGILPNFTLLDDTVELSLAISSSKLIADEGRPTLSFDTSRREYTRGVSVALHELAPGATFYAQGIAATIDAVDLGGPDSPIQHWRVCPECSHTEVVNNPDNPTAHACPECQSARFADQSQIIPVVQMRKVSAEVERDRAQINDAQDDRLSMLFHSALTCTFSRSHGQKAWYLKSGFGAEFFPRVDLRWLNLGRGPGETKMIAGSETEVPLFRVCSYCGHIDSEAGANSRWDHRPWCKHRYRVEEDTIEFALGRSLSTQGVLLHIPRVISVADSLAMPSLVAAIKLGFKEVLGGDPDHLDVAEVTIGGKQRSSRALLLHDRVPGGTGYLNQFASADKVRELLLKAWERVSTCRCRDDARLSCPDCLLPYSSAQMLTRTSRAAAEASLLKLLVDNNKPGEGADPYAATWDTQTEQPEVSDESELELRFREILRQALEDRNATITESFRSDGVRELSFTLPGHKTRWSVVEQYSNFKFTIPDFYISTDNPNIRNIAVYLDGAEYHHSGAHNRVESDIIKRSRLYSEKGILPWTLTWSDLDQYLESRKSGSPQPPTWFNPQLQPSLVQKLGVDRAHLNLLTRDPMSQLLGLLENAHASWLPSLSEAATYHLLSRKPRASADRSTISAEPHVGKLTITHEVQTKSNTLKLNSDSLVEQEVWNLFLNLANLMWIDPYHATVTVDSIFDSAIFSDVVPQFSPEPTSPQQPPASLWSDIFAAFDDEEDVVEKLKLLEEAGVPKPEIFADDIGPIAVVAAWPDAKLVVLYDSDPETEKYMTDQGWTPVFLDDIDLEIPEQFANLRTT